jgi:hypothetical protein
MAVIGEAYFHIKPFETDANSWSKLGEHLSTISNQVAERAFWFDASLEIELAPGSAKGWITARVALGVFLGVAAYSDFRSSVQQVYADVKWFAENVNETFIDSLNLNPEQVFRTEKRTKAIGRLIRLLNEIDELNNARPPSRDKIDNFHHLLQLAIEDLTPEERDLVLQGLNSPGSPIAPRMPLSKYIIAPRAPRLERKGLTRLISVPSNPTYEIKGSEASLVLSSEYVLPSQLVLTSASTHQKPLPRYKNTIMTRSKRQKN